MCVREVDNLVGVMGDGSCLGGCKVGGLSNFVIVVIPDNYLDSFLSK